MKEEDFRKKAEREEWHRLQKKFDRERKEKFWREEDEKMKKMEGDARERRTAANMCRLVNEHYDGRREEDMRERIPKARHTAPIHPPAHDDDRREAAEKLARLERREKELREEEKREEEKKRRVEEEAKKEEERKREEKKKLQVEIERQRDILVRVDDDESRGNSTRSRRDSPSRVSSEGRRPPGYTPGRLLSPTAVSPPSTRPSRQQLLSSRQ